MLKTMTDFCKKIFFLFLLIVFSQPFKAQVLQDSVSVVISLTADNQTNISNVKSKIQALPSVHYIGFCNNHKVFLMYVDSHIYDSKNVFLSNLIKSTGIYDLVLKDGAVSDILNFCDFKDPLEHDINKRQQGH